MASGTVTELWRFPVKSMRGEPVDALRVDSRGAGGDRTHAVWDGPKRLTAREAKGLLAWSASYDATGAELDPADPPPARVTAPDGRSFEWGEPGLAEALAADLGRPSVQLRRDSAGQQDLAESLLVTTQATLRALEEELGAPVDPRRFRANLHLDLDAAAWQELGWEGGRMTFSGGVVLDLLHPCERCVIPTLDPDTREKWPGLLRHLARAHETLLGVNARVEIPGTLRLGERVVVDPPSWSAP